MVKEAPSFGRIAAMVIFSLSCFALLLFLWVSFGGTIPLRPNQYELIVDFPKATTLAQQADVRISGVPVGKVHSLALDKRGNRTRVTLYIDPKFAPLPRDTTAILRQKTLLGETFVELSPGDRSSGMLKDGSILPDGQVEPTVELDEILRIFDPATKAAFREWVASSAKTIQGTAPVDLSDALGNLAAFAQNGAGLLSVLNDQNVAVRQLVHNTGVVFAALNERQGQLAHLITASNDTFGALASEQNALASTFQIFPTFLDESRLTLARLESFAINTTPLINDLKPDADKLGPTVQAVAGLSPDLVTLFQRLPRLINDSKTDLPAGERFITGASPVLDALHVFLPELNPILSYLDYAQDMVAHFLSVGGTGFHHVENEVPGEQTLALAQFAPDDPSLGFHETLPTFDRGSAYDLPNSFQRAQELGMFESLTCGPAGGQYSEPNPSTSPGEPACFQQPPQLYDNRLFPFLQRGQVSLAPSPRGTPAGNSSASPTRPGVNQAPTP